MTETVSEGKQKAITIIAVVAVVVLALVGIFFTNKALGAASASSSTGLVEVTAEAGTAEANMAAQSAEDVTLLNAEGTTVAEMFGLATDESHYAAILDDTAAYVFYCPDGVCSIMVLYEDYGDETEAQESFAEMSEQFDEDETVNFGTLMGSVVVIGFNQTGVETYFGSTDMATIQSTIEESLSAE